MKERSPGSWTLWIDLGRDHTGKRRQKTITVKGSERQAQRELNRLLAEAQEGSLINPSKLTLAEYLERWLADYAKVSVSTKTYCTYVDIVRLHIAPGLGRHKLANLQPLHVQAYYSQALQSGRKDGKGGLSPQTVLHHHRMLRTALQQAVRWQMIPRNPIDLVEPPRVPAKEMNAADEAATVALLKAAHGSPIYVPVLLAVTTGLRRGEILGLRWSDLELTRHDRKGATGSALTVRQTLGQSRAGLEFKQPKTARSRRRVELPPLLVEAMLRHQDEQQKLKALVGAAYQDQGLVFAYPDGRPIQPDHLSKQFAKLSRSTGAKLRFHDLRHSHASQLLKLGESPNVVSERLGHADPSTTLRVYGHVLPGMGRAAAQRIDGALRAAMQDPGTGEEPPAPA